MTTISGTKLIIILILSHDLTTFAVQQVVPSFSVFWRGKESPVSTEHHTS
jgi:hypothetical protein